MQNERIRLNFDEEHMQELYIEAKISLAKLVEFAFLLGSLANTFAKKDGIASEQLESAYTSARHVVTTILQALPESATDEEIESYIMSGAILDVITSKNIFPIIDTLSFNIVNAAVAGKATATTLNGEVVDLILDGSETSEATANDLLDLVEGMPAKKLDA